MSSAAIWTCRMPTFRSSRNANDSFYRCRGHTDGTNHTQLRPTASGWLKSTRPVTNVFPKECRISSHVQVLVGEVSLRTYGSSSTGNHPSKSVPLARSVRLFMLVICDGVSKKDKQEQQRTKLRRRPRRTYTRRPGNPRREALDPNEARAPKLKPSTQRSPTR